MEDRAMHIVIVGHVDHGKSTLVGRLFYDTGSLPPDKFEEIKASSAKQGRELEFAFVMDNLEEERTRGVTIDIAHTFFKTSRRRYVIIDAPGHKEFLKNMISGTSQAETAILLVDVSQGVKEQTLRHCYILSLLGIRQIAVLLNKMDLVDYSEQVYEDVKKEILAVLERLEIAPSYVIPVSASKGENIARREKMEWYGGPTVLEALDNFETLKVEEKGLRLPVQDVYAQDGSAPLTVGRVEAGVLKKGQDVVVLPGGHKARIKEIRKHEEPDLAEAPTGDCVGVVVEGEPPKRGDVLSDSTSSMITDTVSASIFWMVDKEYSLGLPLTFRCATQDAAGRIEKIHKRFDPASAEMVLSDLDVIRPAEVAVVDIKLERPVVVDSFSDIPELGRFVLEHAGHPVAGGIIT